MSKTSFTTELAGITQVNPQTKGIGSSPNASGHVHLSLFLFNITNTPESVKLCPASVAACKIHTHTQIAVAESQTFMAIYVPMPVLSEIEQCQKKKQEEEEDQEEKKKLLHSTRCQKTMKRARESCLV